VARRKIIIIIKKKYVAMDYRHAVWLGRKLKYESVAF
jgi:hypothetical protein